jgi:hypothetical protein
MLVAPWFWLCLILLSMALLVSLGPAEKSLGVNVRVVYLHGAWVWTALAGFVAAGLVGGAALLTRRSTLYAWSAALGRTGLLFWITYLPISLWAMQTNWNGWFLAEPRWRLAAIFAVSGFLLQAGLAVLRQPWAYAAGNLAFVFALLVMMNTTEDVLHPSSPIFSSDSRLIQFYFIALLGLTLAAGWQVTRWWLRLEPVPKG